MLANYGLGFTAGVLSTLSPCVLPLLPIVIGSALSVHRLGALALASGLALAFTAVGVFIAAVGFSLGLDAGVLREFGALLLLVVGAVLLSRSLQARFAQATAGLGDLGQNWLARLRFGGLGGQFALGLLLGLVWSPCVGPTLGAATLLASQSGQLAPAALLMLVFGIGAALPLLLVGTLSRQWLGRVRGGLLKAGSAGKRALGAILVVGGVLILSGLDRALESTLVAWSPAWLTTLTTRF
ncbi:cytochrome c biogenesis CcdA family protein [Plasticicumulans acidivorans]|uniref:Cytochrome c biogenesis transmembrane protein n=1 Tax=Plasticicumulans acidivorans TaxID=886464 RepID=A0A317N4A4_9GAMM|nr:cytochrome c biogenesis CcdA family protein [Plasticicumulans acidivorans]PWV65589.1 cytochrome c biogenesis transmembrane protein [Plasticicumulans acidivorans]